MSRNSIPQETKNSKQESSDESRQELTYLSQLHNSGKQGVVCVKVTSVSESMKSRNGWQYRKMTVSDESFSADILISEEKYSEWKFKKGDCLISRVRSSGIDNEGNLTLFFNEFLGPFESSKLLFDLCKELYETKMRSGEKMKSAETVYQISAREAKSLLELIKLWVAEGKPQHYTKWCQMHQIVATNLYYMGLVKRTASMSGYYYPTEEALDFFKGKIRFPKKKVFTRDSRGKHLHVSDEGEMRTFQDYLGDYADRESALHEYSEALNAYKEKIKAKSDPPEA